MKHKQIIFIFSLLLIAALAGACGPTTATPTPMSSIPKLPATDTVQVNQNNPIVSTACQPSVPTLNSSTTFCANQGLQLGGATAYLDSDIGITNPKAPGVNCSTTVGPAGSSSDFKVTCYGPQNQSINMYACNSCGPQATLTTSDAAALGSSSSCSKGFVKNSTGITCVPDPSAPAYAGPCPAGSHYDNAQQWCVDDATNQKLTDLCPAGTQTYLPNGHWCVAAGYPERYNCQTFTIPLGVCLAKTNQICQPPVGGCGTNPLTGGKKTWNQTTCSCQ